MRPPRQLRHDAGTAGGTGAGSDANEPHRFDRDEFAEPNRLHSEFDDGTIVIGVIDQFRCGLVDTGIDRGQFVRREHRADLVILEHADQLHRGVTESSETPTPPPVVQTVAPATPPAAVQSSIGRGTVLIALAVLLIAIAVLALV